MILASAGGRDASKKKKKTKAMNSRYDDRYETCWCCNNYLEGIQGLDLDMAMALRTLSSCQCRCKRFLYLIVFSFFDVFYFFSSTLMLYIPRAFDNE